MFPHTHGKGGVIMNGLQRYLAPVAVACCLTATGCGSSDSTTGSSSTAITTAYPSDLAVTSPTSSSSATATSISKGMEAGGVAKATATPPTVTAQQQKIKDILNATSVSGCTFSVDFTKQPPSATCYGPTLNFSNHPDGTGVTQLPQGDLGIWTETDAGTGEACVAAKTNSLVGEIITNATMAQELVAAVLCRAKLAGKGLPEKGASQDLKTEAAAVITDGGLPMTIGTASIARATDDSGTSPVFTTAITGVVTFSAGAGTTPSDAFEMNLKHIPAAVADNSTYKGRLSLKINRSSGTLQAFESLGNCSGSNGLTDAMSIEYHKTSETALTYAMRRAEFCGIDASPFDSLGNVDPAAKKSAGKPQGWANDGHYALFNLNPSDGSGNFQYAWQAGSGDGNTRVLNVKVDSGGTTGCGYFGFGPDIAAGSTVGSIDRMICNWAGPGNSHTGVSKAQRQCFTKSGGKYVSNASNLAITYAPTNACDKTAAQNFSYQNGDGTQPVAATADVTNNLIGLTQIDVTAPTYPSVP